ncbi:NAD(P)H-binding protein [Galbibacter orientalis]|uniref:NAD(P)H-binding protein n=1 Tax=Galbibacter orientalis TaxID=453852 RepID=UPI0030804E41
MATEKIAIILGATGLTGSLLLKKLIKDDRYKTIKLFSRSATTISDPKIKEHIVDLLNLELSNTDFTADEVYCCIGTTKSKTPNKSTYKAIDYGIPMAAAALSKANNINTFIVISALGANPKSKLFYNRIKGKMEKDVLKINILNTYILQPSLISGKREEKRAGEWFFKQLMKALNYIMVGPLKKYQSVAPEKIATTMVYLANNNFPSGRIKNDKIKQIAETNDRD